VNGALEFCLTPQNDSFLTRVLGAGLTRFSRSAFGAFEIKNAVEEAGQEQTARLYRATDAISVIGTIAPLLGLLGTVLGMVGAFDTLSAGAAPDHKQLASNISLALVCTLLGLILAIPCLALFTFFRNRIDGLAAEAATVIEQLLLHLESPQGARAAAPSPRYTPSVAGAAGAVSVPGPPVRPIASAGGLTPIPNPAPPGATFPGRA
jgi:biopolymer transport protein ExbB